MKNVISDVKCLFLVRSFDSMFVKASPGELEPGAAPEL